MKQTPQKEDLLKINNFLEGKEKIEKGSKTFEKLMFIYSVAIRELVTKIEIIKDEFKIFYDCELIDHIKTRIKKPESILKKMKDKECSFTYIDMVNMLMSI